MSWSYRADRTDEVYASNPGPTQVTGAQIVVPPGGTQGDPKTYTTAGAIDVRSHTAYIGTGASPVTYTLAAPTANNIDIFVVNSNTQANIVTATGLLNNGTTGSPHNQWASAAFPGSSIHLRSLGGQYHVVGQNLGTVS